MSFLSEYTPKRIIVARDDKERALSIDEQRLPKTKLTIIGIQVLLTLLSKVVTLQVCTHSVITMNFRC